MRKNMIFFVCMLLLLTSCGKQNATPEIPVDEMPDTETYTLKYSGTFMRGDEGDVMGAANIYVSDKGMYQLELKDFSITNGPDLHVYLSQEKNPVHFIDLGKLKSTKGNQLYNISSMPDFAAYKYTLIHCQQYNVLFASSELMQ